MGIENRVAVVTDTGCSIHPESPLAQETEVNIASLDIKFFENSQWVSYEDSSLTPSEFYQKMRTNPRLPQTSGAIPHKLQQIYESHASANRPVISVHITSHHSAVWESANLAKALALENYPHLLLEVIDSKQVSLATWFLVEQAAILAQQGYPLEDIKRLTLETIPKIDVFTALSTFDNIVKGGRLPSSAGYIGSKLQLRPILGVVDGEIKIQGVSRTNNHAQRDLARRVENTPEIITRLAVIHTNYPEGAESLRQLLSPIYSGNIEIYEARPVLGVHTGEKSLGIALQKK